MKELLKCKNISSVTEIPSPEDEKYIIKYFCLSTQRNIYIEKEGMPKVKKFLVNAPINCLSIKVYKVESVII